MQVYAVFNAFGIYLLDEESKVLHESLTYPNVDDSVDNVRRLNEGNVTNALQSLVTNIPPHAIIVVSNPPLGRALSELVSNPIEVKPNNPVIKWFFITHDDFLLQKGLADSSVALQMFRREVGLHLARLAVSEAGEEEDTSLKHAIDAIDEIDKSINVLGMRLREWYSIHFPVLSDIIEDHEHFASVIQICGSRTNITKENLDRSLVPESLKIRILDSSDTLGAEITSDNLKAIQSLSDTVLNLYAQRKLLENYVESVMEKIAPNITSLVGPLIGARLIRLAGSLSELARKPSSTLQILGAEKALFRSLKTGAAPPKHGVIYQVPEIHSAPYWQRGKVARALAGKLAIAAKIDAFSDSASPAGLRSQFEQRLAEIQRQNPTPPPPKPPQKPLATKDGKRMHSLKKKSSRRRKKRGGK